MTQVAQAEHVPSGKKTRVRKNKWEVSVGYNDGKITDAHFSNWTVLSHFVQSNLELPEINYVAVKVMD